MKNELLNAQIMDYRKDELIKARRIELVMSELQNAENTMTQYLLNTVKRIVTDSGVTDDWVKIRHMINVLKIDKTYVMKS